MTSIPPLSPTLAAFALFSTLVVGACSTGAKPAPEPPSAAPSSPASEGAAGSPPMAGEPKPAGGLTAADLPKDAKPMEATVDLKNTIRWATASEVENFGYDVYRGEGEEGPFVRLTAKPIPGAGTSDEPHKYSYVDKDIDPTKEYWYYVESISFSGVRERFTPVQKAKAKQPKEEAPR